MLFRSALEDLIACLRQPARWFLRKRLSVYFEESNTELEDAEPFDLTNDFALDGQWLHALLAGTPLEERGYEYFGPRAYEKWIE